MTHPRPIQAWTLILSLSLALLYLSACSPPTSPPSTTQPPASPPVQTDSSAGSATPTPAPTKTQAPTTTNPPPPLTINRAAGTIDLPARMVRAKPDWLELIATTEGANSRDHEAIVTIKAKPSQIHLALLTLGLEPGRPLINQHVDGEFQPKPPTGPNVRVFFVYESEGQTVQVPAHQWVIQADTGQPLADAPWLFTGSQFRTWRGQEYYMADENGNAVSLVNFGDDLIVRQTLTTQNNDAQALQLNEVAALPYGTPLTLRIQILPPPDPAEPAEAEAPASSP